MLAFHGDVQLLALVEELLRGLWAAASASSTVIVPQGLAGPPGPSGPALVLSQEELQVSDLWPGGKGLPVVLSHVLLLLRSPVCLDQEDPATPSPPTLVLVPSTSHPLPQHLMMLLVGESVVSLVISPPFPFSTSFIPPTT